jgi:class 3 adenylate cyclase
VINADYARDHAEPGQIVVTDSVRAALAEKYRFTAVHNQRQPALWLLEDA